MAVPLPPTLVASALYDHLLQDALKHFLERARFETQATPSESSLGMLAIEPSGDPSALIVRWFGYRHVLRVSSTRPFTPAEVRLAKAIGAVLQARYRAIFDPRVMAENTELFRGSIEDRFIGAYLDGSHYEIKSGLSRADRLAGAIEILRVAALSTYENHTISTGVLMLGTDSDPRRPRTTPGAGAPRYSQALAGIKGVYRLGDGVRTTFLVSRSGALLDIIDIGRWAAETNPWATLSAPCAQPYEAHARATVGSSHVCIVLSPTQEIKVFAEGTHAFTFRQGRWELLDLQAKYELWLAAVGDRALAERLFQAALNLSDAREGALFVVLRDPASAAPHLIAPGDLLSGPGADGAAQPGEPSRRDVLNLVGGRTVMELGPGVLLGLASMDGATVVDRTGRLLAVGAILRHPITPGVSDGRVVEGARTTAAIAAGRYGPVLKVSEDGGISFHDGDKIWDI